jgi:hypothetical protein
MTPSEVYQILRRIKKYHPLTEEQLREILLRLTIKEDKGCWIYHKDWSVYATYKGKGLHRLMFQIFKREIFNGNFVCHLCDRKGCVNPDHLYQGTATDNLQDMRRAKRLRNHLSRRSRASCPSV